MIQPDEYGAITKISTAGGVELPQAPGPFQQSPGPLHSFRPCRQRQCKISFCWTARDPAILMVGAPSCGQFRASFLGAGGRVQAQQRSQSHRHDQRMPSTAGPPPRTLSRLTGPQHFFLPLRAPCCEVGRHDDWSASSVNTVVSLVMRRRPRLISLSSLRPTTSPRHAIFNSGAAPEHGATLAAFAPACDQALIRRGFRQFDHHALPVSGFG